MLWGEDVEPLLGNKYLLLLLLRSAMSRQTGRHESGAK
jgi:hypothetical protein